MANTNVVFDELPDYRLELNSAKRDHLRRAINDVLAKRSPDGSHTWENLVETVREDPPDLSEGLLGGSANGRTARLSEYQELFSDELAFHAQFDRHGTVHALAPAIGRAMTRGYAVGNGRYRGYDGRLTVVFDESNTIRVVHHPPDLSETRCVIGLDAHPSGLLWSVNTVDDLRPGDLLDREERQYWRTEERGLFIVQIDEKTNPLTQGWREDNEWQQEEARAIIQALHRKTGEAFRTCICPKSVKDDVRQMMREAGIEQPRLLHYGGEKSLNVFAEEVVGLLLGCIDPGDHTVLDNLALLDLFAEPKMIEGDDGMKRRAYGRQFEGEDADAATEFLEAVRETHIAQSIGRYARTAGDAKSGAIVYVWTDAIPKGMCDAKVPGVIHRVTEKKQEIEQFVREQDGPVTKREVAEAVGVHRKTAWEVLKELTRQGVLDCSEGIGKYGADEYEYVAGTLAPTVDLTIRAA